MRKSVLGSWRMCRRRGLTRDYVEQGRACIWSDIHGEGDLLNGTHIFRSVVVNRIPYGPIGYSPLWN